MSKNEKNVSVRGLSHVFKNFCTWLNSQLSPVAKSGDYNDLSNKPVLPQINVDASDGSWVISRDTDGNFFRMVHTGWSRSGSNSWAGMYFQTSDNTDVFAFAARQSTYPLEKFTVGNNGYIRGYDTNGSRSVTLTINGGTAGKPDTQNITIDGTFVNAGNQRPFEKNRYTIGTPDMPYQAMYAGTFNTNTTSDSGLIASNSSTKHSLLFGISSTGVNRGIYDNKNKRWSVFLDGTDYIMTQCPTPPAGDNSNKLATTGWVQTELDSTCVQTAAVDQTIAGTKTFSKPIVGSVTGSSGSCTGNSATATRATSADRATNADHATRATQDSDGNKITTTYSKVGHTHDDRYYTETEVNNLLGGKANTSGTYSNLTVGNAGSATNATYANWLRTSSNSDYLFHTEWDGGYFWTYVTAGDGSYRPVRVARSDSAATAQACTGNAATATKATQDAAGNTITTTYATKAENNTKANNSEVVHKSGDETIAGTKTFNDNVHASGFHATASNALMAQRDGYTLVLRNDGDNTYLLMSDKGGVPGTWNSARPLVISNSTGVCDINGNAATATTAANADHATSADSATKAIILKSNSSAYHEIRFDWSRQVNGRVGIRVDAVDLGGIATTSGTYGGMTVGSATRATQDSDGHQISTTYIKRTDAVSYNIGACFIGFYSSASHISNIGNGGRLAVGATTSASNLYDTITTTNSNTVVCSRNITLAGVWKLISVIKYNVFSENYAIVESTRQAGSSFAAGVVAVQGLFIRVS